jgi:hypothetical protein
MARAVRMEERAVQLRCLDLDEAMTDAFAAADAISKWLAVLSSSPVGKVEAEVAIRVEGTETKAWVPRLEDAQVAPKKAVKLQMSSRGSLTNLRPVSGEGRRKPGATEAEIRVRAIGLNFRDVLNVMGLYPGDPGMPGADSAGTVLEVGEEVTHVKPGEDVFGESPGCLQYYNVGPAPLLTQKPEQWSFEAAACMPVIFVTVEESLGDIAKLKKGESVLIHAAAGGV